MRLFRISAVAILALFCFAQVALAQFPVNSQVTLSPDKAVYENGSGPTVQVQLDTNEFPNGATIRVFVMRKRDFGLEPVVEHGPAQSAAGMWVHQLNDPSGRVGRIKYFGIAFYKVTDEFGNESWFEIGRTHDYSFKAKQGGDGSGLPTSS